MLSKALQLHRKSTQLAKTGLMQAQAMSFSAGPYNPLHYKAHLVPHELPT